MTKLIIHLLGMFLILTSCGKKASVNALTNTESSKIETSHSRKLKAIKIGQAEDFAILAYASIYSTPSSSIDGKVGLMPGIKKQITLDPSEVIGGASDIIGSDDETNPINLLSNAKVDMVTAYKEAVALTPDEDKVGLYEGKLSAKTLLPGCYMWNSDLTITSDFTIEGTDSDIWVFKIPANFKVSNGVHLKLSGGANAKNIFWQVAGSAVLESGSVLAGTIIAQQSIEMKNHSLLTGRVFAKNGFITLNQAIIKRP